MDDRYYRMGGILTDGFISQGVLEDYGRGHISSMEMPKWIDKKYAATWGKGNLRLEGSNGRLEAHNAKGLYYPHENKIGMKTKLFDPNTYLHELGHAADREALVKDPRRHDATSFRKRARLGAAGLAIAGAGHDQEWAPALAAGSAAYGMWSPLARSSRRLIGEAKANYNGYKLGPMLEKRLSSAGYRDWKWNPWSYSRSMLGSYMTNLSIHIPRILRAGGVLAGAAALGAGVREAPGAYRDVKQRVYGRG